MSDRKCHARSAEVSDGGSVANLPRNLQVSQANFSQALRTIRQLLPGASYVSIDLELTGTHIRNRPDTYLDTPDERLEKACDIAECYTPVQLGLTLAVHGRGGPYKFWTCNIWVAPESSFTCDMRSLKFLRSHSLDLNKWVDEGVRCTAEDCKEFVLCDSVGTFVCQAAMLRLRRRQGFDFNHWVDNAEPDFENSALAGHFVLPGPMAVHENCAVQEGLECLWQAIHDAQKPLVVHGHLDVFFLVRAIEGRPLPKKPIELASLVKKHFPRGIYDTSFLHEKIPPIRLCKLNLQEFLECVRKKYSSAHGRLLSCVFTDGAAVRPGGGGAERPGLSHEAGFDSWMTALLYAYLFEMYEAEVCAQVDHLYLHKSAEGINLNSAARGMSAGAEVFDFAKLQVLKPTDAVAKEKTASYISEARRAAGEPFFYRWMDDDGLLLIPDLAKADLVKLAMMLQSRHAGGIRWVAFVDWQREARRSAGKSDRRFIGVIKRFDYNQGFGFIDSPIISRLYGGDVFLHWRQRSKFKVDDLVSFSIELQNTKPQARNLELVPGLGDVRFTGIIKDIANGRTFHKCIDCYDIQRIYLAPVLLGNSELGRFSLNEAVSFKIRFDCKGQPFAHSLTDGALEVPPESRSDRRFGHVKSYDKTKQYGFITTKDIGDVFVHSKHLYGRFSLSPGERVEFDLAFSEAGKPQARNCQPAAA